MAEKDEFLSIVDPTHPFSYEKGEIPQSYICGDCGAHGCKLWRDYQAFLQHQTLRCAICAGTNQGEDVSDIDDKGRIQSKSFPALRHDQIGWLVPAVPTEENDTFWGYTSVPPQGVVWWHALPTHPNKKP